MKWRVEKWDDKNQGCPRVIFEGTEKKARQRFGKEKNRIDAGEDYGVHLLQVRPICCIIVATASAGGREYKGNES